MEMIEAGADGLGGGEAVPAVPDVAEPVAGAGPRRWWRPPPGRPRRPVQAHRIPAMRAEGRRWTRAPRPLAVRTAG